MKTSMSDHDRDCPSFSSSSDFVSGNCNCKAELIAQLCAERDEARAENDALAGKCAIKDAALQMEFEFYDWYLTAPSIEIIQHVTRRREEVQQACKNALADPTPAVEAILRDIELLDWADAHRGVYISRDDTDPREGNLTFREMLTYIWHDAQGESRE